VMAKLRDEVNGIDDQSDVCHSAATPECER
jgi:hypothetical protein